MSHHTFALRPARWAAGVVLGAVLVGGVPASAQSADAVTVARRQLAAATNARRQAEARVAQLGAQRDRLEARLAARSAAQSVTAAQLAAARETMRERVVEALIAGGADRRLAAVLGGDRLEDIAVRSSLLMNQASVAADAADAYRALRERSAPEVVRLALQIDEANRVLASAKDDLLQTSALEADAERALTQARNAARAARAAQRAATTSTTRPAAASRRGATVRVVRPGPAVDDGGWAKLVKCESGGNYAAVSATGRYRGAYQFDRPTWASVGGTGDPAAASPAEQDLRARMLYEQRGARAWPHCGIHLRG